jgi:hypothetical protein
MRFEDLWAVTVQSTTRWDVKPFSMKEIYRRFGGTCFHPRRIVRQASKQKTRHCLLA